MADSEILKSGRLTGRNPFDIRLFGTDADASGKVSWFNFNELRLNLGAG